MLTVTESGDGPKKKSVVVKRTICLGDYLPTLPKVARDFLQTKFSEDKIRLHSDILRVNKQLGSFCQELLNMVDIFFIQNLLTN